MQWAVLQGDSLTGVTTMLTDRGIDTGDMLLKAELPIGEEDTAGSLLDKLSHTGAGLLIETLRRLEAGTCPREKQDEAQSTYDPMLKKEMGLIDFTEASSRCVNRVRAMNPWPCAYAPLAEGVLRVWRRPVPPRVVGRPEPCCGQIKRMDWWSPRAMVQWNCAKFRRPMPSAWTQGRFCLGTQSHPANY